MESITNDLNVDEKKINSESDSDNDDDVPLQQRINNRHPSGCGRENKRLKISQGPIDVAINTEEAQSHTQETILALASVQVKITSEDTVIKAIHGNIVSPAWYWLYGGNSQSPDSFYSLLLLIFDLILWKFYEGMGNNLLNYSKT
ncbi:hypothetical protein MKW98_007426 [Papaver atlanticum]|uniref:Uncharacterized protein n=1 Tax=Papaver atlanticum TaxID=357466 RepID=A0AAD4SB40_9MAGN|nr:hypothetical protein MKW98_007426 [Papaver atlanticum]